MNNNKVFDDNMIILHSRFVPDRTKKFLKDEVPKMEKELRDLYFADFKYHKYWPTLMEVVENIENEFDSDENEIKIYGKRCDIGKSIIAVAETKILAVWSAVVQYIKRDNERPFTTDINTVLN